MRRAGSSCWQAHKRYCQKLLNKETGPRLLKELSENQESLKNELRLKAAPWYVVDTVCVSCPQRYCYLTYPAEPNFNAENLYGWTQVQPRSDTGCDDVNPLSKQAWVCILAVVRTERITTSTNDSGVTNAKSSNSCSDERRGEPSEVCCHFDLSTLRLDVLWQFVQHKSQQFLPIRTTGCFIFGALRHTARMERTVWPLHVQ